MERSVEYFFMHLIKPALNGVILYLEQMSKMLQEVPQGLLQPSTK